MVKFENTGIRPVLPINVWIRANWEDPWVVESDLYVIETIWSVNPTIPQATLRWDYGRRALIGAQGVFADFSKREIDRIYVKIEWVCEPGVPDDSVRTWYGVIENRADMQGGGRNFPTPLDWEVTGQERYLAYGLEKLLEDVLVISGRIRDRFNVDPQQEADIGHAPVFNHRGQGNRTAAPSASGTHTFEPIASDGQTWSTLDIVEYLLKHFAPRDSAGGEKLPFALGNAILPNWDSPEVEAEGSTCWDLLNQLIDRRRLFSFHTEIDEQANPNKILIIPHTLTKNEIVINLPGAANIPANPNTRNFEYDTDQMTSATLNAGTAGVYNQVIARGRRRRDVGTWSVTDTTLEPGWSPGEETIYDEGASTTAGYAGLDRSEKQKKNNAARTVPAVENVYSLLKIPETFDGTTGDGEGGPRRPLFLSDVVVDTVEPFLYSDATVERTTPLVVGGDYSGDNKTEPLRDRQELPPLVFFQSPVDATRYIAADRIGVNAAVELVGDLENNLFSCYVVVPENSHSIRLKVSGRPQHVIAGAAFPKLADDEFLGSFDYRNVIITASLIDPRYAEGIWPAAPPAGLDYVRTKIVYAGDQYRKDYIAPDTVVGTTNDGLLIRSNGGYIADDTPTLTELAKIAHAWYGVERFVLALRSFRLKGENDFKLGDIIEEIGDQGEAAGHRKTIDAPISEIRFSAAVINLNGLSEPEMVVTTFAGELDVNAIEPERVETDPVLNPGMMGDLPLDVT